MKLNEYLTVKELSQLHNTGTRNIRRIISELEENTTKELMHKDKNNRWMIHHILSSKFKPKNKVRQHYYALTIDPSHKFTERDIHMIMQFVIDKMEGPNVEMNYVVERKKANNHYHVHCFINCKQRRKLIENLRLGFSELSYVEQEIYDLPRWKKYITKDGNRIITIKKN